MCAVEATYRWKKYINLEKLFLPPLLLLTSQILIGFTTLPVGFYHLCLVISVDIKQFWCIYYILVCFYFFFKMTDIINIYTFRQSLTARCSLTAQGLWSEQLCWPGMTLLLFNRLLNHISHPAFAYTPSQPIGWDVKSFKKEKVLCLAYCCTCDIQIICFLELPRYTKQ